MPDIKAAQAAFDAYDNATGNNARSDDEKVTDLLTELLHWAAASAAITDIKTPESIVESARFHYEYETEPEEGDDETESEGKG
jgi:hypothetical protein